MTDKTCPEVSDDNLETVLIHLYRGEVQRVNTWRNRLDRTPHWTIIMAAGMITWSFSSPTRSPALILLTIPLAFAVMLLEANRYQMHEVWRSRLRLLEENFIANMLDPNSSLPRSEWMEVLSRDLKAPEHKVTLSAALAVRLRKIYLWVFITVVLSWFMKLTLHPTQADSLGVVIGRASIGFIPGTAVSGFVLSLLCMLAVLAVVGIFPVKEKREGEVLEEEPGYEWRRNEEEEEEEEK